VFTRQGDIFVALTERDYPLPNLFFKIHEDMLEKEEC
jgi:hypothetical protein